MGVRRPTRVAFAVLAIIVFAGIGASILLRDTEPPGELRPPKLTERAADLPRVAPDPVSVANPARAAVDPAPPEPAVRTSVEVPGLARVAVTVRDEDGRPLPGIGIALFAEDETPGDGRAGKIDPRFASSDDAGRAAFEFPPGKCFVVANKNRPQFGSYSPEYAPGFAGLFDLGIAGLEAEIVLLRRDGAIDVLVTDDLGQPVAGIEVVLTSNERTRATTDAIGVARFTSVPANTHTVELAGPRVDRYAPEYWLQDNRKRVTVPRAGRGAAEFRLLRRGSVSVRWVLPRNASVEGFPAATVRLEREPRDSIPTPLPVAATASESTRIHGVVPGRYSLRFDLDARSALTVAVPVSVEVKPGEVAEVAVELAVGGATLGGRVVDWLGRPCEGVHVWAFVADPQVRKSMDGKSTVTDADGAFRIAGLPAVAVTIRMAVEDRRGDPVAGYGGDLATIVRRLGAPAEGLQFVLERGYRIDVEVVSAATGKRIVDPISVRIDRYYGTSGTTKSTGTAYAKRPRREGFVAFEHLHAGTFRLVCVDGSGTPLGPEVEVVCGGDATDVSVALRVEGK